MVGGGARNGHAIFDPEMDFRYGLQTIMKVIKLVVADTFCGNTHVARAIHGDFLAFLERVFARNKVTRKEFFE